MELQLICHQPWQGVWDETVLLPNAQVMPLLHQQLEAGGSGLEVPPRTWQEPTMWLEQLQQRPIALAVCPALAPTSWWQEQGIVAVADQPTVRERLGLLLPDDIDLPLGVTASLRLIRRRLSRAMARRESALFKGICADGLELVGDGEAACIADLPPGLTHSGAISSAPRTPAETIASAGSDASRHAARCASDRGASRGRGAATNAKAARPKGADQAVSATDMPMHG